MNSTNDFDHQMQPSKVKNILKQDSSLFTNDHQTFISLLGGLQ